MKLNTNIIKHKPINCGNPIIYKAIVERIKIVTFCILNNDEYIVFYNTKKLQKNLKGMTPIEYRNQTLAS